MSGGVPVPDREEPDMKEIRSIMIDDVSCLNYDRNRSQVLQAFDFMDALYKDTEYIVVGGFKATQPYHVGEARIKTVKTGVVPEFISVNPIREYRLDVNCTSFRYGVLESDYLSIEDSLKLYAGMIQRKMIKPVTITMSGSKSVHCIYRTKNIKIFEDWTEKLKPHYKTTFSRLGFDHVTCNPSRLTRLAGHYRKQKYQVQQLLGAWPENGWRAGL